MDDESDFELWAVWPDLAKFRHFCKNFQILWQLFDSLFLIWQNAEPTLANLCDIIGLIFIVANGQM